jgi:hypothetical protein
MKALIILIVVIGTFVNTCIRPYKYHIGTFPETPVNMGNINSAYDDYNASSPILGGTSPLCFSSNRISEGKSFDIVYKLLDVIMHKTTGELFVGENNSWNLDIYSENVNLLDATAVINSMFDELGPYLVPQGTGYRDAGSSYPIYNKFVFLYASNDTGNFDIKFTQNLNSYKYSAPKRVQFLNSQKDDTYPTLNQDNSYMYFSSNRNGNFDIYKTALARKNDLLFSLRDSVSHIVTKDSTLSSDYEDKCPFINGKLMVFTSNRPGGFGGYDLYYSTFQNDKWSTPVNFGDKINTQYDEFRPIVKAYEYDFTNDFMIFSSNRPGGKGGFDLYYVGITRMTK